MKKTMLFLAGVIQFFRYEYNVLFLAGVIQFFCVGGFANKRESSTYNSVYYLHREKMTKNTLNMTLFWENVFVPLYG
jgi:hypothetical protein